MLDINNFILLFTPTFLLLLPKAKSWIFLPLVVVCLIGLLKKGRIPSKNKPPIPLIAISFFLVIIFSDVIRTGHFSGTSEFVFRAIAAWLVYTNFVKQPTSPRYFWLGLALGCIGTFAFAFYQLFTLNVDRASGHTNALTFGQTVCTMGLLCFSGAIYQKEKPLKYILWTGAITGTCASFLTNTRGIWLALIIIFIALFILFIKQPKHLVATCILVFSNILTAGFLQWSGKVDFGARSQQAIQEQQTYTTQPVTSVGARMVMWNFAWDLYKQKPVLGWGSDGYFEQRQKTLDTSPVKLDIGGHAHNEILNIMAKYGTIGLFALLFLYAAPLIQFFRMRNNSPTPFPDWSPTIRLSFLLVPLSYFLYGLTDSVIFWNEAIVMYFYTLALLCAWSPSATNA